jgi:hypothetical protein
MRPYLKKKQKQKKPSQKSAGRVVQGVDPEFKLQYQKKKKKKNIAVDSQPYFEVFATHYVPLGTSLTYFVILKVRPQGSSSKFGPRGRKSRGFQGDCFQS